MLIKRGVIAVIYSIKDRELFFLILHRSFVWSGWEFPKSSLHGSETSEQAIKRVVEDSVSLKKFVVENKFEKRNQFVHRNIHHIYDVFIVKADMAEKVDISNEVTEHDDFKWATAEETLQKLYWDNEKREVERFVKELKSKKAIS